MHIENMNHSLYGIWNILYITLHILFQLVLKIILIGVLITWPLIFLIFVFLEVDNNIMKNLRVVEFEGLAPSVFCGLYFADQGA